MRHDHRTGATLLELLVVLAVMAILAGLVGPALASAPDQAALEPEERALRQIEVARHRAILAGTPVVVLVHRRDGRALVVRALADGSVAGASSLGVDPLTGRPTADDEEEVTRAP